MSSWRAGPHSSNLYGAAACAAVLMAMAARAAPRCGSASRSRPAVVCLATQPMQAYGGAPVQSSANVDMRATTLPLSAEPPSVTVFQNLVGAPSVIQGPPAVSAVAGPAAACMTGCAGAAPLRRQRRNPEAARRVGVARQAQTHRGRSRGPAGQRGADNSQAKRNVGAKLLRPVRGEVPTLSFDASRLRTKVQLGVRVRCSRRSARGRREAKTPSSDDGSSMSAGVRIQANVFVLERSEIAQDKPRTTMAALAAASPKSSQAMRGVMRM